MIEIRSVTKRYRSRGGETVALAPVSASFASGELTWVSGPSGVGKSTLLGIVGLLVEPDAGEVWFDGVRMDTADDDVRTRARRRRLGFVPQSPRVFPELTAWQNVALATTSAGREQAAAALVRVGLADQCDQRVGTLSGGQQQRVSLARAFVNNPRAVLADEPSSGLDDLTAEACLTILRKLADDGRCVVVTSHDSRLAPFADRTLSLTVGSLA